MNPSARPSATVRDVSVTVPTIGRAESLRSLLESLRLCDPRADEIVVVDQSGGAAIQEVVEEFAEIGARRVPSDRRGVGSARNAGLRAARHETILITDDDCTVAPSWVEEGWTLANRHQGHLLSGRVLPGGDPKAIPSIKLDEEPEDFAGMHRCTVLYSNNMVATRSSLLAFGGFDERLPTASDNDLCYRWLHAGRPLRYEPSLVVWHHELRDREGLERRYVEYWRGQGMFYGKHLRGGDLSVLRFLMTDIHLAMRATAAAVIRGRPRWTDSRRGVVRGLPAGMLRGLAFRRGEGLAAPVSAESEV
jgi:glycosyltransferase involved in cell wall biosynthesis